MNKTELENLIGISLKTLYNWEREKLELVRLINQGFALDELIEETKENASNCKFNLKGGKNG